MRDFVDAFGFMLTWFTTKSAKPLSQPVTILILCQLLIHHNVSTSVNNFE